MFRRLFLLLFSAFCSLALVTLPARAGVQFEVTRWEVSNDVLNIEWINSSDSSFDSESFTKENNNGDIYYLVRLPAWSRFTVLPGWTIDGPHGLVSGDGEIVESRIVFEEGDVVTLEGDTNLTARFFAVRNDMLIMAHYVPFFQSPFFKSPDVSGRYAYRWTLKDDRNTSKDYFHADETVRGQAKIASYQYPIAGVYDSRDPNLIRYHLALMKMTGIDGVILDFYGKHDNDGEYPAFLEASNELVKILKEADMSFAVCYEENAIEVITSLDKNITDLEKARQDFKWLDKNWFNDPLYISDDNRPVVLVFPSATPIIKDWNQVIDGLGTKPLFVLRDDAEGAYNWMINTSEDEILSGAELKDRIEREFSNFFRDYARKTYLIGTAFPAFDDKTFKDIGRVPEEQGPHGIMKFDGGNTFKLTLDLAMAAKPTKPDIVQLAVWNDHIEGTALEPTIDGYTQRENADRGYGPLEYLQSKKRTIDTSFLWNAEDLRTPIEIYKLMVGDCATPEQRELIDKAYNAVWAGNPAEFRNYARQAGVYGLNITLRDSANLRKAVINSTGGRANVKRKEPASNIAEFVAAAGEIVQVTPIDINTHKLDNFYVTYNGGKKITLSSDGSFTMPPYQVSVEFTETIIPVTGVTLDKTAASLVLGETTTVTLNATVVPANAANKNVSWDSGNPSVASVANGTVTALSAGTARITITTLDGNFAATCDVTVTERPVIPEPVRVTGVTLDKTSASLVLGETTTVTLNATVTPANAANKNVSWDSGNPSVASVANGIVTALSAGTARITVTTLDGNFAATCDVTVTERPVIPEPVRVTGVTLDKTSASLVLGETNTVTLNATVAPANAANKNISWRSSNPSVASVANGIVTATDKGTSIITVTTDDSGKTATCRVTVTYSEIDPYQPTPITASELFGAAPPVGTSYGASGELVFDTVHELNEWKTILTQEMLDERTIVSRIPETLTGIWETRISTDGELEVRFLQESQGTVDVTLAASGEDRRILTIDFSGEDSSEGNSSSSGGCSAGYKYFTFAFAIPLILKKR